MKLTRPNPTEHDAYYGNYIQHVTEEDVMAALESQIAEIRAVLDPLSPTEYNTIHAPYTWTIRQVVGHCIDTERIFGCRACRIAVNDSTPQPGFDQDHFVANIDYDQVSLAELLDELELIRRGNIAMLNRLPANCFDRSGIVDGRPLSLRAVASLLVGHIRHHFAIIQTRLKSEV